MCLFRVCSHAIAGGFSPAMATALFNHVGTLAPGLIYIVFGVLSLLGISITACCGGNQKEVDTGEKPSGSHTGGAGDLELNESVATSAEIPDNSIV
jgi:hypothetical protein